MKPFIPYLIIGGVLLATGAWGPWLYRTQRDQPVTSVTVAQDQGSAPTTMASLVTLEVFGDYQCPPCAELHPIVKTLRTEFGQRLEVIFRHDPLPRHAHAVEASYAAIAAGRQGKFWEMHDWLYTNQASWDESDAFRPIVVSAAKTLGLDGARFIKDMDSSEVSDLVFADLQRAQMLHVPGTPTVYVDGQMVDYLTEENLRQEIQRRLRP